MQMMTITTIIVIVAVGYAQLREGLYTALCGLVNVVLAGIVAFGFFEPVADWLDESMQRTSWTGYEDFAALILLFCGSLLVLRAITNRLAPDMLDFPANAQYGGAALGMVTGYLLAGFLLCAVETLPVHRNFLDFQPREGNDSGPRSLFPPDRVWLSMMRYAGAHALAWEEDDPGNENRFDRFKTFDRHATFELRYARYRRHTDTDGPKKYQMELEREIYKQ
jgi:uncharacterized membrane protein required for colicin V production